ncbi:hypothetical protein BKA66DRAFT_566755 [Pyrenochaeta sp. MPI-SDFR-AT-0127]|nr:hypothetical protein BKA66DRAFT_566755 [Pyrenochaeta sp. MPI-SDFR-AT-0127]
MNHLDNSAAHSEQQFHMIEHQTSRHEKDMLEQTHKIARTKDLDPKYATRQVASNEVQHSLSNQQPSSNSFKDTSMEPTAIKAFKQIPEKVDKALTYHSASIKEREAGSRRMQPDSTHHVTPDLDTFFPSPMDHSRETNRGEVIRQEPNNEGCLAGAFLIRCQEDNVRIADMERHNNTAHVPGNGRVFSHLADTIARSPSVEDTMNELSHKGHHHSRQDTANNVDVPMEDRSPDRSSPKAVPRDSVSTQLDDAAPLPVIGPCDHQSHLESTKRFRACQSPNTSSGYEGVEEGKQQEDEGKVTGFEGQDFDADANIANVQARNFISKTQDLWHQHWQGNDDSIEFARATAAFQHAQPSVPPSLGNMGVFGQQKDLHPNSQLDIGLDDSHLSGTGFDFDARNWSRMEPQPGYQRQNLYMTQRLSPQIQGGHHEYSEIHPSCFTQHMAYERNLQSNYEQTVFPQRVISHQASDSSRTIPEVISPGHDAIGSWALPRYEVKPNPRENKDELQSVKVSLPNLVREELLLSPDHPDQEVHLLLNVFIPGQEKLATPDPQPAVALLNFHTIAIMVIEAFVQFEIGDEFGRGRGHFHHNYNQDEAEYERSYDAKTANVDDIFFSVVDRWRAGLASKKQSLELIRGAQEFCDVALDVIYYLKEHGLMKPRPKARRVRSDKGIKRGSRKAKDEHAQGTGENKGKRKAATSEKTASGANHRAPTVDTLQPRKQVKTGKVTKTKAKVKAKTKAPEITVIRRK